MFLPAPALRRLPRPRRPRTLCTATKPSPRAESSARRVAAPLRTPYHLVHFRRSRFVAHLNELRLANCLPPAARRDAEARLDTALRAAGRAHEARVVEHLARRLPGAQLYQVPFAHPDRYALTEDAIRRRVPLIRGAALRDGAFAGYADLLIHASVDPFADGTGYAVCEIKLASLQTTDFALQAAAYVAMLDTVQQRLGLPTSSHAYLWLGSPHRPPHRLDARTLRHLFRRTTADFAAFLQNFQPDRIPQPDAPLAQLAPWKEYANHVLKTSDSLRLIAGIRRSQARQITAATGVSTLAEFAQMNHEHVAALVRRRKLTSAHVRLHRQARMQYETRRAGTTAFERLDDAPRGMPRATRADLFFDMEGFPLVEGGLEYLFGVYSRDGFRAWWAHTRQEEEKAFVALVRYIEEMVGAAGDDEKPHVFHYGHYEVTALHRVAMRATSKEGIEAAIAFEQFVERGLFFDVYDFVRSTLVIGEPSYSIKKVENLVGVSREGDELADAESSVAMYYEWRRRHFTEVGDAELGSVAYETHPILEDILHYNRQDCESLEQVVDWLRNEFPPIDEVELSVISAASDEGNEEEVGEGTIQPGACGRTNEDKVLDSVAISRSIELSLRLQQMKVTALEPRAKQNLSHLLHFYVRESTPVRRAFRERIDIASGSRCEDLYQDDKCLTGARLAGTSLEGSPQKGKRLYNYSFDRSQPTGLAVGESVAFVTPNKGQMVHDFNGTESSAIACFMTVKGLKRSGVHPDATVALAASGKAESFVPPTYGILISTEDLKVCNAPLRQSILRKAERLSSGKYDESVSLAAAFLNRVKIDAEPTKRTTESLFSFAHSLGEDISSFLAERVRPCVFVIQGPPGSGKTALASKIIFDILTKHNKTVAVSSNSHAAIDNLLIRTAEAGIKSENVFKVGKKPLRNGHVTHKPSMRDLKVAPLEGNGVDVGHSPESPQTLGKKGRRTKATQTAALVGATCYQLSLPECEGKFDFLFVDEASQVTVANFLAMASCAKYAILVGDQLQLEMPIKGSHPGDVGLSCLSYVVGDSTSIVDPSHGIFLEQSYRMNPKICSFVSDAFYRNALKAADMCSSNEVHVKDINAAEDESIVRVGSGIAFVSCDSFSSAPEEKPTILGKWHRPAEVAVVKRIVDELVGIHYTVGTGSGSITKKLGKDDILVVAPYNIQVRALQAALPEVVRVGTVDKFQGQQAPVVVVSLCAGNAPEDNPDGLSSYGDFSDETFVAEGTPGGAEMLASSQRKGLRFSLQKNRLNVALSRAQCLAIVTGQVEACSRMPLDSFSDVEIASLYERLQVDGT